MGWTNALDLSWTDVLDTKEIFWGAFWGFFFWVMPQAVMKWWRRLTPYHQSLVIATLFFSTLTGGLYAAFWVLSGYLDVTTAYLLVVSPVVMLRMIKDEEGESLWGRIIHRFLIAPFLWRDFITRTCNKCGLYDFNTRRLSLNSGCDSAYEPCRKCGSTDFKFHRLQ
jgi:hypothetical protein